ncbi:alpha/beta hydrolase [Rhodococcus sp. MS16]|uniref:alpha/beta fold hydrolase n=1 Tax=Rhodococcus sp. MS16 TaxID=2579941 RepID=UPI001562D53C|nr:alpha/beta hydrolase [Rhodococcus sp. MS16]NRI65504.1 alpha/beta hydrolase [Rhodococcus sp. MS16]
MTVETTLVRMQGDGLTLTADCWTPTSGTSTGTVLLLHGGGQTRHSWQRTGHRLAANGWRAYAIDARGHGDSEWSADGDYSPRAHARDIASMVQHLGEPPVLVGASMGGMAALLAQGADPNLGRGLVLVDITPRAEASGIAKITSFMESGLGGFDSLDDAVAAVVTYNPHRRRPPNAEGLRKNLRRRDGRWYWHWDPRMLSDRENSPEQSDAREARARTAARAITVPTMLIRGAQSDVVSHEGARDLLELIPGARQVDVGGAGHMVSGDDNDLLSEGLLEFLTVIPEQPNR